MVHVDDLRVVAAERARRDLEQMSHDGDAKLVFGAISTGNRARRALELTARRGIESGGAHEQGDAPLETGLRVLRDALRQAEVDGHGGCAERGPRIRRDAHARGRPLERGILPEARARGRRERAAQLQAIRALQRGRRVTQGAD